MQRLDTPDAPVHAYAAWLNQGRHFRQQVRYAEAAHAFQQALLLHPEADAPRAAALNEWGWVLRKQALWAEALAAFDEALSIAAHFHGARANRSLILLQLGRWQEGWHDYEARLLDCPTLIPALPFPVWQGESLAGASILVLGEQGFGDQIQCLRFLTPLSRLAGKVDVLVKPELVRLTQSVPGVHRAMSASDGPVHYDWQVPMFSLPHRFHVRVDNLHRFNAPYLAPPVADINAVIHWQTQLKIWETQHPDPPATRRIGLVWAGGHRPEDDEATAIDQRRSLKLADFLPLFHHSTARFISLQMGQPAEDAHALLRNKPWLQPRLLQPALPFSDFADTAALIHQLDAVIACDTAVAHLAAAMGKPVWLLNRYDLCWRWLAHRQDSPLYPSITILRQPQAGEWHSVIETLIGLLHEFSSN